MFDELATFVTRYRRWLIGLSIAVSLGCAATYPQLEFDFSPQQFFHTDSKLGKFRDEFARTFAREDNLMLVAIEGDDVFEPRVLGTLRNLTLELQSLETVERADSVATFRIPRPGGGPGELTVEPLLEQTIRTRPDGTDRPVPDASAEKLASLAEREPLVHGRFVSKDGRAAAILVWLDREIQAVQKLRDAIDAIEGRLEKHPLPDGYDYRLGGVPPLRVEIVSSLQAEQSLFIPLNALIFVLVLWFLFRRPAGVVLPLGVVVMAVSGTVAMLVATGSSIDIVSNVLPTLIFVIGIADSIHMVTRHAQAAQTGLDRVEAAREAVRHTGFACLMTSTTTAVGFISLVTADSALLVDFGWQAAAGVMLAYVFTLFFLPAGLASMQPVQSTPGGNSGSSDSIQRGLTGLARRVLARPRITVAAGLTIAIGFGVAAYQWVRIDEKLMSVFQRNHPAYRDVEFMEQKFGGFLPVEVSISSPKRGRMKDPAVYRRIHRFQQWASRQPEVLSTQSIVDFHQSARAALLGDPGARDEMPTSSAQVEQLHTLIAGSPDAKAGPGQFVTRDFRKARVLLRVRDVGAQGQLALADRVRGKLRTTFEGVPKVDFRITGDAYAASVALTSFVKDLFYSLLYAGLVILVLMTLIFESVTVGLISMIPNAMPLVVTFGYMGLAGITLNSTTVIIFAIGLGLAVDDTIHVLARFREELHADHASVRDALVETYDSAGRAILFTSVLLLLGMSVLLLSDFLPTQRFGVLISITIVAAILGDLLVLPPILYLLFSDEGTGDEA